MDTEPSWEQRFSLAVGRRLARARGDAGLSLTQLADRCAGLGVPSLSRTVINKMETGGRQAISAAEVLVLAGALGVAPIDLLLPLDSTEVEFLPNMRLATLEVIRWLDGELIIKAESGGTFQTFYPGTANASNAYLLRLHDDIARRLAARVAEGAEAARRVSNGAQSAEAAAAVVGAVAEWTEVLSVPLRWIREEMRRRGIPLPVLPEAIEMDEVPNGEH